MVVLRESPWYQEILQEGERRGLEQGLERGLEQGLEQGLEHERNLVLRVLTRQLGPIPESAKAKVSELSFDQLETLADTVFSFSGIADLMLWLKQY